jgi:hypothetical protein
MTESGCFSSKGFFRSFSFANTRSQLVSPSDDDSIQSTLSIIFVSIANSSFCAFVMYERGCAGREVGIPFTVSLIFEN